MEKLILDQELNAALFYNCNRNCYLFILHVNLYSYHIKSQE